MLRTCLSIVMIGFICSLAHAQEWIRNYGSQVYAERINAAAALPGGGFVAVGTSNSQPTILRVDESGGLISQLSYPTQVTADSGQFNAVVATADTGYIAVGYRNLLGYANWYARRCRTRIVRCNAAGDTLWTKEFPRTIQTAPFSQGYGVVLLPSGDFVVAGCYGYQITDIYPFTYYLAKFSATGDSIWFHEYDADRFEYSPWLDLHATTDGGFMVGGTRTTGSYPNYQGQPFIARFDSLGTRMWQTDTLHAPFLECYGITPLPDGGAILSGKNYTEPWLGRVNAAGVLMNIRQYTCIGGYLNDGIAINGGAAFTGSAGNGNTSLVLWQNDSLILREFAIELSCVGKGIIRRQNGGMLIYGYANVPFRSLDYMLIATDSLGSSTAPEPVPTLPSTLRIESLYPNPFNSSTTIRFSISRSTNVEISLYDCAGRTVKQWKKYYYSGTHKEVISSSDCVAGIYFIKVRTPFGSAVQKAVYIK